MPPNLELSAKELETLGYCFSPTSLPNYCHVLPLLDDDNNARYYLSTGVLNELKVKIKRTLKTNKDPPKNLERRQEIFLSDDIDGDSPFLNRMTLYDAFERARDTHFASLHEVIKLSRSLEDTQVDFGRILTLDDHLVAQFDAMLITDAAALIVTRLFHGFDRCRSASVWDLALAATVGEIRPQALLPVLDLLEHCGGDVSRCREFLAFCDDG